ncbi:feruloyl-CoA synthase [Aquincola sp. S2]|uniref:Feruloyl-CoA synthase n=1 Tax=Pseudaquabacterium terrae TaxID=2732868 RepID=A0ABX2EFR2_9BURK|nr:feruloyl-CoA synthase [Aquabacterium terrae]NRF67447.1 feruloyl-CoA synthase [Aquabacterium terrae]
MATYRDAHVGGCVEATVERRADGCTVLRSAEPLGRVHARLTDALEHWAREAPQRTFAARRDDGGDWRRISYAQMLQRVQSVAQGLLELELSVERPLVILSGNDLEHLTLALAAMWAGIPHAPVSPAYSLVAQDFGKLRHIQQTLTPGAVYASSPVYARAIAGAFAADVPVILGEGTLPGRRSVAFDDLLAAQPGDALARAHAAVGPDTIAKFLFTSGSTKAPKAVINTQRMLCANQQMLRQCMAFLADAPPVLIDWLPWNHTFGGNHNVGIVLVNGGTLYIDDGKPTPQGMAETLRNLREIAPTVYFNVPKGFEEIARAMDSDALLRETLFRNVKAFMFAGAGLAQAVWDQLERQAEATIGERIRVITGLGMTETAPSCTFAVGTDVKAGWIGLPVPGVEVKLVPLGDKTEIRFRGPNVMPGYWRAPAETAEAFDAEGFYCTGDAVTCVDAADPARGLVFDGRIAEDFKLSSGTFVSVGPLRAKVLAHGAPLLQDSVVAGLNRDDIGLLVFPRIDECRRHAGLGADAGSAEVLAHPAVRGFFQALTDRLWREGSGSATRVARLQLLGEPPSLEAGELTDKGSINQRAVLQRRAALVDALYAGTDPDTLRPHTGRGDAS